jgi:predicted dehydrogenase
MPAAARGRAKSGAVQLGILGAGQYARATLLPALKKIPGARVRAVCSASGRSAHAEARASGADYATSDYREALDDPAIDAVIIATRHNLHAQMAIEAIGRGKDVFVEKPPALNRDELQGIADALRANPVRFMVGYNRRFSPHARAVKRALEGLPNP